MTDIISKYLRSADLIEFLGKNSTEQAAEIERLSAAKTAALKVADERSKENCALRAENERMRMALANIADGATKSAATSGLGAPIVALLERISTIARGAVEQAGNGEK